MALEQAYHQYFDYDLTIVGGGIVGATFACALKNSGLRIILIEAQPQSVAVARRQAYALSLLSGRIFQGIGVWDKIHPQIATYQQIRLSDGDYPKFVQFHPSDLGTDELGYVGEHRPLLTSLYEFLADCPNVSWLCPAEVVKVDYQQSEATITVKVEGETRQLRSRLIIAADGSRSRIRTAAGIGTKGWKYWQSCVTARIKTEKSHNHTAFERFWHSGPMGVLPLSENRCQVVWTAPHAEAQALKELDEKEFLNLLEHRTGGLLGHLELDSQRIVFPVQLMQSDRYTQHRLALIGDAAHCCHPVGGQGLNMGIRDAAALAQVLQDAHQRGEDIGDERVLKRYERWRKRENLVILGFTDFLDRMFSNNWLPVVTLRRFGLWMLQGVRPIKVYALQLMTGLKGRAPQLAQR
ncbi:MULTISPECIES: FAD-dependent hydroxylase [unclassified Coleofasciculus]|uniref:FAD-dependent hydroxylase n=1 Tax=unclassified Coleofasciculus TaxID=2692782 RepID=UPI0018821766|nr:MULTISPECIES: FAD-dependent hydroxylase [unclassified Coleofasciculus]MBE9128127.1 FAD-dependent hydroxylase [Coleofasciculus sp. LEGE 07081]MBE9151199.1 FAD-dependent hydroxylase [Coleofasciculus sp. LEGE 07092]